MKVLGLSAGTLNGANGSVRALMQTGEAKARKTKYRSLIKSS